MQVYELRTALCQVLDQRMEFNGRIRRGRTAGDTYLVVNRRRGPSLRTSFVTLTSQGRTLPTTASSVPVAAVRPRSARASACWQTSSRGDRRGSGYSRSRRSSNDGDRVDDTITLQLFETSCRQSAGVKETQLGDDIVLTVAGPAQAAHGVAGLHHGRGQCGDQSRRRARPERSSCWSTAARPRTPSPTTKPSR